MDKMKLSVKKNHIKQVWLVRLFRKKNILSELSKKKSNTTLEQHFFLLESEPFRKLILTKKV